MSSCPKCRLNFTYSYEEHKKNCIVENLENENKEMKKLLAEWLELWEWKISFKPTKKPEGADSLIERTGKASETVVGP